MSSVRAVAGGVGTRPILAVVMLGVALLTMVAGVAALGVHSVTMTSESDLDTARQAALASGRADAKVILSYDYRTLQQNFRDGQQATTGDFRTDYRKTTTKLVAKTAKKYHTVVTAQVVGSSVVSASRDKATLLLYVDQNTVSDLKPNGRIDQNRVLMTVVNVNGKWLVSKLDAL